MNIQKAILAVERRKISPNLEEAKDIFETHLKKLPKKEFEKRGVYYYYLLRISLETHLLFENEIEQHFYDNLTHCFALQAAKLLRQIQNTPQNSEARNELEGFYRLMERYFRTLELNYRRRNFEQAEQRAYLERMRYRQNSFRLQKRWMRLFFYQLWRITSLYNTSFWRWGVTCLVTICFYSLLYYIFDGLVHTKLAEEMHWYDVIHFSIATFTTLGFGDIIPGKLLSRVISDIEVFNGYLMLGAFMGLVHKRVF